MRARPGLRGPERGFADGHTRATSSNRFGSSISGSQRACEGPPPASHDQLSHVGLGLAGRAPEMPPAPPDGPSTSWEAVWGLARVPARHTCSVRTCLPARRVQSVLAVGKGDSFRGACHLSCWKLLEVEAWANTGGGGAGAAPPCPARDRPSLTSISPGSGPAGRCWTERVRCVCSEGFVSADPGDGDAYA